MVTMKEKGEKEEEKKQGREKKRRQLCQTEL